MHLLPFLEGFYLVLSGWLFHGALRDTVEGGRAIAAGQAALGTFCIIIALI